MIPREIIDNWASEKVQALNARYLKMKLIASGQYGRSLRYKVETKGLSANVKIQATHYAWYMENGRRENKKQDEKDIKKFVRWAGSTFLKQWVIDKNADVSPYYVAWKIAKYGITVPNRYNKGNVITEVINDQSIKELVSQLSGAVAKSIQSDIIYQFLKPKK